jgi:predicted dehydrogenase
MRIGILSLAHHHAESYAYQLQALPGVHFLGVADEDRARAESFAHFFGAKLYPSYETLLADQPDGVIVCAENVKHRALAELAAQAGVHVLCEKPLATTLEDGQAMLNACRQADVMLMTAFPMRFSAPVIEVKGLIERGGLGRVLACNTVNQGQMPKRYRDWFVDKELAGGGSLFDHTVHLADILRWYLESEVVEVYAQTNRIMHRDVVSVETAGLVMLTFEDGTFASIDCSWSRPDNYPTWGGLAMDIIGETGVINVDAFAQNLTSYSSRDEPAAWQFWGSDANRAMLAEFVTAFSDKRPPRVTGEDGYKAVEVAIAAYRSAELGEPVRLPLTT